MLLEEAHPPGTGQMSARTDALMSRPETGKIVSASIFPVAAGCHPAVPPLTRDPGRKFSGRHFPAGIRTSLASRHTFIHSADAPAVFGTFRADLRTFPAGVLVMGRIDEHEVSRCPADFGASHHETKVFGLHMFAACFEAVVHGRRETGLVTTEASLDAAGHLFVHSAPPIAPSDAAFLKSSRKGRPS
jgi:hypothetical protein